ncbi:hypothetical protein HK104_003500 [Borealophlyctis nickersoniae]|nr:hypothetical protein HK104_003500 [Borealophlyctis nickersoniae]
MSEYSEFHYERLIKAFNESLSLADPRPDDQVQAEGSGVITTHDTATDIAIDTIRPAKVRPQSPTRLLIFDFDSTLFRSPQPNPRLWHPDLAGMIIGQCNWFQDARTLCPPYLPEQPGLEWWDEETVEMARKGLERDDTICVLMTGRNHDIFSERIRQLALALDPPLKFDMFFFREGQDPYHPNHHPTTMDFKLAVLDRMLSSFTTLTHVEFFDDRVRHADAFRDQLSGLVTPGRLKSFDVHLVEHHPSRDMHLPPDLEKALVLELIATTNAQIAERKEEEDKLEKEKKSRSKAEIKAEAKARAKAKAMGKFRACAAWTLTRTTILVEERPRYTAVFLDYQCSAKLLNEFPPPCGWTPHADHITVNMGPANELTERMGGLGSEIHALVVAFASLRNRVTAVKVEPDPSHPPPLLSENETPHVTISVGPEGKPRDSNFIKRWDPLPSPIPIWGILREEMALGLKKVVSKPKAVSIGSLVKDQFTELQGRQIGGVVNAVEQWMAEHRVENSEANRGIIGAIVKEVGRAVVEGKEMGMESESGLLELVKAARLTLGSGVEGTVDQRLAEGGGVP